MAEGEQQPQQADIRSMERCEIVGDLRLDIITSIYPDSMMNSNPPITCSTYFMNEIMTFNIVYQVHEVNTIRIL